MPSPLNATLVKASPRGIVWFYGNDYPGGGWEPVRFETYGNRTLGRYSDAVTALAIYHRDVTGEPLSRMEREALAALTP